MIDEIKAARPGIRIDIASKPLGRGWRAIASAGFPDGAWPKWQARGASQSEAIENALSQAVDYWAVRKGRPGE